MKIAKIVCVLLLVFMLPLIVIGQQKRLSFDVGTAMNFRLLNHQTNNDDYSLDLNTVNDRYIALSYIQNKLTIGLTGTRTSYFRKTWSMNYCGCEGSTPLEQTTTIGGLITYTPNIGSRVVFPYAGLALERILVSSTGSIGTGNPFPFPYINPDKRFMAIIRNRIGHRVAMVVGTAIRFKPRTSFIVSAQYGRWISEDPFIEYDIRYYSDDFAYEDIVIESGDQIRVAIGFRFDILSK